MRIYVFFAALGLAGCMQEVARQTWTPDQCMRAELFSRCMASLPKGPEHVSNSNDWDEVVSECGKQAYSQSIRNLHHVKPECREQ